MKYLANVIIARNVENFSYSVKCEQCRKPPMGKLPMVQHHCKKYKCHNCEHCEKIPMFLYHMMKHTF